MRIFPETAVLDFNHPLAGQPLIVTLQIVSIENSEEGATIPRQVMVRRTQNLRFSPWYGGACSYGVYGKILCEVQK